MVENTPLALLPLIAGILILTARFYVREGAISIFSIELHAGHVGRAAAGRLHGAAGRDLLPYAWVAFGGIGLAMAVGGIWSFYGKRPHSRAVAIGGRGRHCRSLPSRLTTTIIGPGCGRFSEQSFDLAILAQMDRLGGGHPRQARHGHDVAADRDDEAGAG